MHSIAIIGAGLSGRLLVLNLLRYATPGNNVKIMLIDREDENSMGPAYPTGEPYLLLNVPALRMGALSEDPGHFLKWIQNRGISAAEWDFLPRYLYREYILELTHWSVSENRDFTQFEYICGEVLDIEIINGRARIHLGQNDDVFADTVVLALGNFPPRDPPIQNLNALKSRRYVRNPWSSDAITSLSPHGTVVFIGTGQTMIDLAISLHMRNHKGNIVAISRHGYLPMTHKDFQVYGSFYEEIKDYKSLLDIFRIVRKHLARAEGMGIDTRAVIDSLRPDTQKIWMGFPPEEKLRFIRHVFRFWEIIRSRIPPESESIINLMISSGHLKILAGRIIDFAEKAGSMEVQYIMRGETYRNAAEAELVINCCGPESDYTRIDHPLVRSLMSRGFIRPGPAHLGIDALPNGAIIGREGGRSKVLYTLGSTVRGVLWEVLAVPEIRVQAEQLARLILFESQK
jgi:uncharacterized NAD(P)/FAD-binding protein YdhS